MPREMAGGRIQPQATELEEAVLGAMLIDERAPGQVMDILSKESFYREANGEVFDTMAHLFREGESIDLLTVSAALRKRGHLKSVGGDAYLAKLSQSKLIRPLRAPCPDHRGKTHPTLPDPHWIRDRSVGF